jgi:hypothetical protein
MENKSKKIKEVERKIGMPLQYVSGVEEMLLENDDRQRYNPGAEEMQAILDKHEMVLEELRKIGLLEKDVNECKLCNEKLYHSVQKVMAQQSCSQNKACEMLAEATGKKLSTVKSAVIRKSKQIDCKLDGDEKISQKTLNLYKQMKAEAAERGETLTKSAFAEQMAEKEGVKPDSIRSRLLRGKLMLTFAINKKKEEESQLKLWRDDELSRKKQCESGLTVVANLKRDKNLIKWAKENKKYVFIGRGMYKLGWGNPFGLEDGGRDACIDAYMDYYWPLKTSLHSKVSQLKGKVLGCYCYPKRCHGDFLAELANNLDNIEHKK